MRVYYEFGILIDLYLRQEKSDLFFPVQCIEVSSYMIASSRSFKFTGVVLFECLKCLSREVNILDISYSDAM